MTDINVVEDFTEDTNPPIPFKIDDDVFYAVGDPPAGALLDLAELASLGDNPGKAIKAVADFLDTVLLPSSAELFASRMRNPQKPIKQTQLMRIIQWLVQQYGGGRPTVPASPLQGGQASTGPSTMATASTEASTPGSFA